MGTGIFFLLKHVLARWHPEVLGDYRWGFHPEAPGDFLGTSASPIYNPGRGRRIWSAYSGLDSQCWLMPALALAILLAILAHMLAFSQPVPAFSDACKPISACSSPFWPMPAYFGFCQPIWIRSLKLFFVHNTPHLRAPGGARRRPEAPGGARKRPEAPGGARKGFGGDDYRCLVTTIN